MTAFTKPVISDKAVLYPPPQATDAGTCESRVDLPDEDYLPHRNVKSLLYMLMTIAFLLTLGVSSFMVMMRTKPGSYSYQALCHIPLSRDIADRLADGNFRVVPVTWYSKPMLHIVSTLDETQSDDVMEMLNEELDIGNSVEKISVVDNGKRVNFIHDFSDNVTGIVDDERCFIMDLEPDIVMPPELFVSGLTAGDQFDVSKVRTHLRAALPAIVDLAKTAQKMAETCFAKPAYRLYPDDTLVQKRSAEPEPHDYIQFSGKHVQEIKIDNLAEILKYEESLKKKN